MKTRREKAVDFVCCDPSRKLHLLLFSLLCVVGDNGILCFLPVQSLSALHYQTTAIQCLKGGAFQGWMM